MLLPPADSGSPALGSVSGRRRAAPQPRLARRLTGPPESGKGPSAAPRLHKYKTSQVGLIPGRHMLEGFKPRNLFPRAVRNLSLNPVSLSDPASLIFNLLGPWPAYFESAFPKLALSHQLAFFVVVVVLVWFGLVFLVTALIFITY